MENTGRNNKKEPRMESITFEEAGYIPYPMDGSWVRVDGQGRVDRLYPCSDWDQAPFRLGIESRAALHAVKVEVIGKVLQELDEIKIPWVRVQVTKVGDGDPDEILGGWMLVDANAYKPPPGSWETPTVSDRIREVNYLYKVADLLRVRCKHNLAGLVVAEWMAQTYYIPPWFDERDQAFLTDILVKDTKNPRLREPRG